MPDHAGVGAGQPKDVDGLTRLQPPGTGGAIASNASSACATSTVARVKYRCRPDTDTKPCSTNILNCSLAVDGATPDNDAGSPAGRDLPPSRALSIRPRAGSPIARAGTERSTPSRPALTPTTAT